MDFPVVIYGCERWTIKKAEHQRKDAFELWCWRRLLRVPWTARSSNQSILKEINLEYSLEELMLKLKLQHLKNWFTGKDPDAGKDWRQKEKWITEDEIVEWHHWLSGHEFEQTLGDGEGQGSLACCSLWDCKKTDITEQQLQQCQSSGYISINNNKIIWLCPWLAIKNETSSKAPHC